MAAKPPTFLTQRISISLQELLAGLPQKDGAPDFEVVIIGSGYGGSIAASRLAAAGKSVCLLERGREIRPGEYPTDLAGAKDELQVVTARHGRLDPHANGMMELRVGQDVHVITGNGLGGGSLVNAGVSIRPDPRVFDTGWPQAYKGGGALDTIYDRVAQNLGAAELPCRYNPPKLRALEQSARAMGQDFQRAEINVTFKDGKNVFGFEQKACTMCGDCCSGCNYGAKNTLLMNYLPDAAGSDKTTIVTEAEVTTIAPVLDGTKVTAWDVRVRDRAAPDTGQALGEKKITAGLVILAAGALGSTEILLRSRSDQFTVSKMLGAKFSTNGDVLGFGFGANLPQSSGDADAPRELFSIGAGSNAPDAPQYRSGPCITGVVRVDMADDKPLTQGMVIEDGTAPGALAAIYPPLFFLQDALTADWSDFPDAAARLEAVKELAANLQSGRDPATFSYEGVMTQMQSYLVMSHDKATGQIAYNEVAKVAYVCWPDAGKGASFVRDNDRLKDAAEAIWANYIANPIWQEGFGRNIVSVHPLGGCPMADSADEGVTDADCRVYRGDGTDAVYDNLLVCDGSVIPTALGVNPLLTISAITERAMDQMVGKREQAAGSGEASKEGSERPSEGGPSRAPEEPQHDPLHYLQTVAMGIGAAKVLADLITDACKNDDSNNRLYVSGLVGTFLAGVIPGYSRRMVAEFVYEVVYPEHYSDLGKAFQSISDDLCRLFEALGKSAESDSLQPFLAALFDIVGDISPGFRFDETMQGFVSDRRASQDDDIGDPYEIAEGLGRAAGRNLTANFRVNAKHTLGHDADGNISAQIVDALLGGEVDLKGEHYKVTNGKFNLLLPDPDRVETWVMTYECDLEGKQGVEWKMSGTKYLRNRPGSFWWTDLTTLYVDLTPVAQPSTDTGEGGKSDASKALQGIIRLDLQDLAKQVSTISTGMESAVTLDELEEQAEVAAKHGHLAREIARKPGADKPSLLQNAFGLLLESSADQPDVWPGKLAEGLEAYFAGGIARLFGNLVLRSYGGFVAYMNDFPSRTDTSGALPQAGETIGGSICEDIALPKDAHGPPIRLFHFAPPDPGKPINGPILLAPGMSTTALSYALKTNETSLVRRLLAENYDVWLFDSRLSPLVTPIQTGYTLDDIAAQDWPKAVDYVLNKSAAPGAANGTGTLQILGHCVGALTAQMALLGGHVDTAKVRQLIVMQFTVQPAAAWFNVMKAETGLARDFANGFPPLLKGLIHAELGNGPEWDSLRDVLDNGIEVIDPVSPMPGSEDYQIPLDQIHNTVDWSAPFGIDHMCLSPTCHRIYGLYGPVIAHQNVNEATHNAMRVIFGKIATKPFEQLGLIMERGRAVSAAGDDIYLPNYKRLNLPIHIISGTINQIVLPESGYQTLHWLKEMMPKPDDGPFTRTLIEGYAHNDCIIGKNADRDVFDGIMQVLGPYGQGTSGKTPGEA